MRYLILLSALFLLVACQQSPQKRYYVLSSTTTAATNTGQPISTLVGIGPIEIADYLKRPNMVRMRNNNTLNLTANDYWAEPLDKGITRILALNLTQHKSSRMVQVFPWRSDSIPPYSLRVQIHELVLSERNAQINASWELMDVAKKISLKREHFVRNLNAGTSAADMAEAYSELLGQLAEEMNKALVAVE
jgi:uncharacterized lipoprotein YmbA